MDRIHQENGGQKADGVAWGEATGTLGEGMDIISIQEVKGQAKRTTGNREMYRWTDDHGVVRICVVRDRG